MSLKAIEVSFAISEAVKLADVDVVSAYPITPQTHIVERLSSIIANGELDAEFILVESEHSAMSACIGAAAIGARTFTSTSSQGLALMSEMLYIASGLRLPIVMAVANRALSAPINIWNDHSDIMAQRDCGWIQLFAENGQETFDMILQAYRIGEDKRVHLPVCVNLDGFILTHVIEPIDIPDETEVRKFLGKKFEPLFRLHPDNPITMGPVGHPDIYTEVKKSQEEAILGSKKVILEVWDEFAKIFGRKYAPIKSFLADDAEVLFLLMGGIAETATQAIEELRRKGVKAGLLSLKLWRPFPFEELFSAVKNAKVLIVIDRAISFGGPPGPLYSEVRSALYGKNGSLPIYGFVMGLGGRDVRMEDFLEAYERTKRGKQEPGKAEIIGLRE
jgi:pyruvate ferredoxin oxidoreductase alpha subunit